ncbi:hypothetical protein ABMA32_13550 [Mesorhizobium sp. VNQ89]|uniref:hypothetical protein n=1 Tax=Mesorhizobium quangtriensis TaxID=3157709 RepID=UPI0032B739EB
MSDLTKTWLYRIASGLILIGFAMLCQPFTHDLFAFGFPVLLAGVVLFMILDHVPDARPHNQEEKIG